MCSPSGAAGSKRHFLSLHPTNSNCCGDQRSTLRNNFNTARLELVQLPPTALNDARERTVKATLISFRRLSEVSQ